MPSLLTLSGWLVSPAQLVPLAHHFDADGHSACRLWTQTTLDQPAGQGVKRCPVCVELVERGVA